MVSMQENRSSSLPTLNAWWPRTALHQVVELLSCIRLRTMERLGLPIFPAWKTPFSPGSITHGLCIAAMKDFAAQFSSKQLRIASVGSNLGEILCGALVHQENAERDAMAGDVVETALCILPEKRSFSDNKEITMYGSEQIPCPGVVFDECFPVLIIDNFNVAADKNKELVTKLFQEASQFGKIKPLHGNLDNADYELTNPFEGDPRWNTLSWPIETLRELIRPLCEKYCIDPVKVLLDGAQMLPVTAQDRAKALVMGL